MVSPSHYQSLSTSCEDEHLHMRNPPGRLYRKKCGTGIKCIRIIQIVSLSLTASCLGLVGYAYWDRQLSASLGDLATEQVLSTAPPWRNHLENSSFHARPLDNDLDVYAARPVPSVTVKVGAGSVGSSSPKVHLSNKPPTLPNPNLFGTFLDLLESADRSRYVTAIPLGGINNQMTGTYNLINLGRLSSRTVILPPIIPNEHQVDSIKGPSYSRYYDLPRMTALTGIKVVEWNKLRKQVPDSDTGKYAWTRRDWKLASNPLKCWVASKMGGPKEDGGRSISSRFGRGLMLDIQPEYAPGDRKKGAWRSMATAVKYLGTNASTLSVSAVSKDVACLTESYWLDNPHSVHDTKGLIKALRFTKWLEDVVDDLIAQVLGTSIQQVKNGKAKFITVHLRRNDIAAKCNPAPKNWKALALTEYNPRHPKNIPHTSFEPLELETGRKLYKRKADWTSCRFTDSYVISRVNAFRDSLHQPNIPVILTTDDTNPDSLAIFDAQANWHRFSLEKLVTHDVYDGFDSVMIDACLLTRGVAFLGTGVSMMSRLASHRGRAWYSRHADIF